MPLMKIGSKRQVFNGTAEKTSGGLKQRDLMTNKNGKVVSIKQHDQGCLNATNLQQFLHKSKYGQECRMFGARPQRTVARKSATRKSVARKPATRRAVSRRSPTQAVVGTLRRSARLATRKPKLNFW